MDNLTTSEIFRIVWNWVQQSTLYEAVPTMYADHFPQQDKGKSPKGEFMVLTSLANVTGDSQVATVNVNIYVPDQTPSFSDVKDQRYPDRNRLAELTRIAYDSLKGYPQSERWFFDVSDETLISEEAIPYTFSNIKVKLKRY